MCLREYSEEEIKEMFKTEGVEEGIERGKREGIKEGIKLGVEKGEKSGRIKTLLELVESNVITIEKAASMAGMTEEELYNAAKEEG